MDTNLKNTDDFSQPAKPKACYRAFRQGYKILALILCAVACVLLVFGARNARQVWEFLSGEQKGQYIESNLMYSDLNRNARLLKQYHAQKTNPETEAADILPDTVFDPNFAFCLLNENGAAVSGNAQAQAITALPVFLELHADGSTTMHIATEGEPLPTLSEDTVALLGPTKAYMSQMDIAAVLDYRVGVETTLLWAVALFLLLVCTLFLLAGAGRRPDDPTLHMTPFDWLYLDLQAVALFFLTWGGGYILIELLLARDPMPLALIAAGVVLIALIFAWLAFMTSCARWIKKRTFWRHTLCVSLVRWVYRKCKQFVLSFWRAVRALGSRPLQLLALALFGMGLLILWLNDSGSLWAFAIGVIMISAVALHLVVESNIAKGIHGMREGSFSTRVGKPRFCSAQQANIIDDLNNLASSMEVVVEEKVKAQSMKTELITNVSHDLKTPLTSILAYAELLKQEKLPPPPGEYVEVLWQKSQQLKRLTEDLFEAAKAASGNLPLNLDRLDVCHLLRQGIGELEDRIEASELDWQLNLPETPLFAIADGRYLWRAVENLCSNALKYAMPGTRVYLDAAAGAEYVSITMKNVSRDSLNITAEALTERFVRGDSARTSEGSGLGLSIAKSLTELMHGRFQLFIDGDLFKVTIEVPAAASEHEQGI